MGKALQACDASLSECKSACKPRVHSPCRTLLGRGRNVEAVCRGMEPVSVVAGEEALRREYRPAVFMVLWWSV
jgi:hypothetical protein